MASRSAQDHYSDKCEQSQDDRDVDDAPLVDANAADPVDDNLLSELDMAPAAEACSDAEIMAALDVIDPSDDVAAPEPVTPVADWLTDVQELARKHGPFAPWQIVQIICALNAIEDPTVEAGQ